MKSHVGTGKQVGRQRSSTAVLSLADWFKQNFPGKHAMLSYQWDIQDKVVRARKRLEELGVPCWQDIDGGMQADIYVRPLSSSYSSLQLVLTQDF